MLKRNRTGADAKAIKKLESAVHKLPGVKSDVIHDSLAAVPDNKEDPKKAAARPRPPRPRPTGKKLTPVTQRNQQTIEKIAQEYQKSGEKEEGGLVESGGDTAQPAADDLPGLSVAEMEQAMTGIPNVDGFLKLLEDDTPIDSHWDLVESFQVRVYLINSLGPGDTIWRHRTGSTLAHVMACCLKAPSHHLNQY